MSAQAGTQILSFGITVALVRLLDPSDFGIVALSGVFVGFIILFEDLAIGSAIIQRDDIDEAYLSTSFWASMMTGFVLFLATIFLAPFVALFFKSPILKHIIWFSSLGFLIGPLTTIQLVMFKKKMEFNKLAGISIFRTIISGATAISLAFSGFGVWSLVVGEIVA